MLHSLEGESRVVLIGLEPGQELGEHQVKESALLARRRRAQSRVEAGDEQSTRGAGELFRFDPDERHSVTADGGARLLLAARALARRRATTAATGPVGVTAS